MKFLRNVPVAALLLCSYFVSAQQSSGNRTNIIFIFADDLGYGDVGCYGQQKIATPHIDNLAQSGMKFTQFYAGATVCAPSRASFMTGLHTGHTAIRGNRGMKPEGQFPFPDSIVTIASLLQQKGYATAAFGKWGMGGPGSTGEPLKKGIDRFYGYNCQTLAHNYYPAYIWDDQQKVFFANNETAQTVYSADTIHRKALEFLAQQQEQPFFMYLPYTIPHGDVQAPHDEIYDHYVKKFNEPAAKPRADASGSHTSFEPYPHAAFAAMITRLDNYVGDIVAMIELKGLSENTLIIFSSDNGPHREGGGDPEFFNSNGIYRGIKRDLYEGGIRVPFIACWKGTIKAGTTYNKPAALWDLYPTFQQLAHMPVTKNIDGISILPALQGKKQKPHDYFYWELHESGGRQAALWGQWKAVRLNISTNAKAPIELYDLKTDPSEENNIAAQHPDIVKKLAQIMRKAHVPNSDWPLLPGEK